MLIAFQMTVILTQPHMVVITSYFTGENWGLECLNNFSKTPQASKHAYTEVHAYNYFTKWLWNISI